MDNGLLFQGFEWYISDDGNYYKDFLLKLEEQVKPIKFLQIIQVITLKKLLSTKKVMVSLW